MGDFTWSDPIEEKHKHIQFDRTAWNCARGSIPHYIQPTTNNIRASPTLESWADAPQERKCWGGSVCAPSPEAGHEPFQLVSKGTCRPGAQLPCWFPLRQSPHHLLQRSKSSWDGDQHGETSEVPQFVQTRFNTIYNVHFFWSPVAHFCARRCLSENAACHRGGSWKVMACSLYNCFHNNGYIYFSYSMGYTASFGNLLNIFSHSPFPTDAEIE